MEDEIKNTIFNLLKKDMRGILEFVIKSYKKRKEGTKRHISYFNKPLPFFFTENPKFSLSIENPNFWKTRKKGERRGRATVLGEKEEKRKMQVFFHLAQITSKV